MGEVVLEKTFYSVAEHLELERNATYKSEYHDGEIFAVAGGTPVHSLIANNTGASLRDVLRQKKKPCFAYKSDLQIAISDIKYVYPAVSVICGDVAHNEKNSVAASHQSCACYRSHVARIGSL